MKELKKPKGTFYCVKGHQSDGSDLIWSREKGIWICSVCGNSARKLSHIPKKRLQKIPTCCPIT